MPNIPDIMKTELFWAAVTGVAVLFVMLGMIICDKYRRPDIYSSRATQKPEND